MAYGYSFTREGDGYRFFPDFDASTASASQPRNIFFWVVGGSVLLAIVFKSPTFLGLAVVVLIVALVARGTGIDRPAVAATPAPSTRTGGFLVTPEGIVTERGERIATARMNRLDIRNEMDAANASFSGSPVRYQAGSGRAVIGAIGHDVRLAKTKTRYIVTVQHGPTETVLAKRLDENGANGLVADIQRVIDGQSLD